MLQSTIYSIGWLGSQPIISIALLRYLVKMDETALYASQFFIRLGSILICVVLFFYKILSLQHPLLNSPYQLAQPFRFSYSLVFTCSVFECISLALTIHAMSYYNVIHFLGLYQLFRAFFRSWINNVTPNTIFGSFILMGLVYLLEDWLIVLPGNNFQNKYLSVKDTFRWQPLLMVIGAAASHTFGIWLFKVLSMKLHQSQKAFIDRICWANFIADEPDKISSNLCVVNSLFSQYLEAQLRAHCDANSMLIDEMTQKDIRLLIEEYFKNNLSYGFPLLEELKKFNFNKEATDDPNNYYQEDTLLRRLIKERIYQMQLEHQQYKELFGNEKYQNLAFEIIYEDYGVHEYIWDDQTPQIQLIVQFFEGIFCFFAAFFNNEFDHLYQDGFLVQMDHKYYYIWITIFLGAFQLCKINSHHLMFLWGVSTYFFCGIFAELIIAYIVMLWIEPTTYLQMLGLITSYVIMGILYRSAEKVRDQKNKYFYLSFVTFLIRVHKFSGTEGSQIIQMLSLCAEKLSLSEFLVVLTQILCTHGIVSSDQLRHIKFSHFGKSPFFQYQIPFIFQSQLRYENHIDATSYNCESEHEPLNKEEYNNNQNNNQNIKFERAVIESNFLNEKKQIHQEVRNYIITHKPNASQIVESRIQ